MSRVSRRSFLQLGAGLLALSRLRPVQAAATASASPSALHVLGPEDVVILTAVAARMVDSGDAGFPKVSDTDTIATIDRTLLYVEPALQTQVKVLLKLVEYSPLLLLGRFSTFTQLDAAAQDEVLRAWARSRYETGRLGFRALKNLSMLGYYSQDSVWPFIHYRGPWLRRPRRVVKPS